MKKMIPHTIVKIAGIYVICLFIHFLSSFIIYDSFEITLGGELIVLAVTILLCLAEAVWKSRRKRTT